MTVSYLVDYVGRELTGSNLSAHKSSTQRGK
jgi:hypothetical protein